MYELIQVLNNTYYINCPAKIGLYLDVDKDVYLIDSGNDKEAGRKVRQILDKNGWTLRAILCTHSHADHIGGCKYLQAQTGCKVYSPGVERDFTRHTLLEPALLYGGFPPKALRHKFLMAQESDADELASAELPEGFEIIPLPGHCFEMVGFRTPDDVVFLADCLSSRATLEKYRIGFIYDVQAYLDTLEKVKSLSGAFFVPAHAEACEDVSELAQYNIDTVNEIAGRIKSICTQPVNFEALLKRLFDEYALELSFEQYALVGSTVKSYLAWLMDKGQLKAKCESNLLLWEAAE
ncbi:metallo-beta-lactamase domain protein [Firmicutes bacterium CAG:240]|nr:MAG: MBL fold metallo-hydrolase [Firmicutes bacterium CAG:24053_14]CDB44109.1 metallo-beta-lactamase domain protein [Firmicutes bacterium CAG:240]